MEITKLDRDNVQTLRAYIDDYLMDIEETLELRLSLRCKIDHILLIFESHEVGVMMGGV